MRIDMATATIALLLTTVPAAGQIASTTDVAEEVSETGLIPPLPPSPESVEQGRAFLQSATSGDNNARAGFAPSSFQIRADTDDSNISLTLSSARDDAVNFGETNYAVTLTAPITDKKHKNGFLITRDGLPSGFSAEFSLFKTWGSYTPPPAESYEVMQRLWAVAQTRCLQAAVGAALDAPATAKKCPSTAGFSSWGTAYLNENEKRLLGTATSSDAKGFVNQSVLFTSLTGAIGVEDFDYADPTTFAKSDQRKVGYSFALSVGYSPRPAAPFFVGGFEFRKSWEAPDAQIRCPAASGSTPVQCTQAVFAPAERQIDDRVFGLTRIANVIGPRFPVALELKAAYDIKDDVFGLEMPIYAFLDEKQKLRGGVRVGWDTDKKDLKFGVFIGAPFNKMGF